MSQFLIFSISIIHYAFLFVSEFLKVFKQTRGKILRWIEIIWTEALAVVFYVIPHALKWLYRKSTGRIKSYKIHLPEEPKAKPAFLHMHNEETVEGDLHALLLLHGDNPSPIFTMLHLADIATDFKKLAVFSLSLTYNNHEQHIHHGQIKEAVRQIGEIIESKGGTLKGVIFGGHSRGGTEGACAGFTDLIYKDMEENPTKGVFSIAGFLQDPDHENPIDVLLKSTVKAISDGIIAFQNQTLYQVLGTRDWDMVFESAIPRTDQNAYHLIQGAMHLNVLYHEDTLKKFRDFLRKQLGTEVVKQSFS